MLKSSLIAIPIIACLSGSALAIGCATTVYYVDESVSGGNGSGDSWTNAYTTLQDALGVVSDGEIWVAAGTYYPTTGTVRTITFRLKNCVSIYGGFNATETTRDARDWKSNVTTLSGDIGTASDDSDNSYRVVYGDGSITAIDTTPGVIYLYTDSIFNFPGLTDLIINNQSTFVYSSPTDAVINLNNITIRGGGILTHNYNTSTNDSYIDLALDSLTIEIGGSIDVSGKGYAGGTYRNAGQGTGGGYGNNYSCGGGSYAGLGPSGSLSYGDFVNPNELGSGGGMASSGYAGAGGGLLRLNISGILTNNGSIISNGGGSYHRGCAGAGGTVYINVETLSGTTGLFSANGGNASLPYGTSNGLGSGGGRIAIYANTSSFSGTIIASGGTGRAHGGAGTIYEKIGTDEYLTIDNNNISYNSPATTLSNDGVADIYNFQKLNISNGGHLKIQNGETIIFNDSDNLLAGVWSVSSLTLDSGAVLTHLDTVPITSVVSTPGAITLYSGSTINLPSATSIETTSNGSIYLYYGSTLNTLPITNITVGDQSSFMYSSLIDIDIDSTADILIKSGGIFTHDYNLRHFAH